MTNTSSPLLVGTAELAAVLHRPAPLVRAAFAAGFIPLKSERRAGAHCFSRPDANLLAAVLAVRAAIGNDAANAPLDERLKAFYLARMIEMKALGKPGVEIEPDFDSADYLRAAVGAGVADGSLPSERAAALAAAIDAAAGGSA